MPDTRQKKNKRFIKFYWAKSIIFFIALISLLWSSINLKFSNNSLMLFNINIFIWLIAYLFVVLVSFILHYTVYRTTIKKFEKEAMSLKSCVKVCLCKLNNSKSFIDWIFHFFYLFFSSDYLFAKKFKEILKQDLDNCCPARNPNQKNQPFHYSKGEVRCTNFKFIHYYNDEVRCANFECEEHLKKKSRKLFIINSNWANIFITCILVIIAPIIIKIKNPINLKIKDIVSLTVEFDISDLFLVFLLLHTLSRGIEIVFAFYKDVTASTMTEKIEIGKRHSSLKRGNRISLAIHSYLEITFLFGLIYFFNPSNSENSLLESVLYSFSLTAFNISFDNKQSIEHNLLHVSQILIGMTLVILSIANYLGLEDEMSDFEKSDFKKGKYI
ncbi:hypothetical protein [Viridibacillus arvi]|uniref:Uncharacterized protein n=1 Tax=Viridibacillus arvi TaxID=263475 RepID=A0A0M0L9P8_9BACL|nr:hypothetical protein [Viridibacillus arvi]KOO47810.1 hypothetical protein AMD00_19435 [Viridibacillus arvi]